VGLLRSLDGLEVALFGKAGSSLIRGGGGGTRVAGGRIILAAEDREKGRPTGLGSVGGPLKRDVRGKEGGDASKLCIEPGFQGGPCRERGRRGNKLIT